VNPFHAVGQDLKFLDGRLWHLEADDGDDRGGAGVAGAAGGGDQNHNPLLCSHVFIYITFRVLGVPCQESFVPISNIDHWNYLRSFSQTFQDSTKSTLGFFEFCFQI